MIKTTTLSLVFLFIMAAFSFGQTDKNDDFSQQKKNIIRWNITPMIVDVTNLTLGYERLIRPNQSISINVGLLLFPEFLDNDSLEVSYVTHGNRFGFSMAIDYRFYLSKRNVKPAPDGLYIGPYFTHYQYRFDNVLRLIDNENIVNDLKTDASFSMTSIGFELGYQFIFWDKLSLDLIMVGPSLSYYRGKVQLEGDLGIDEDGEDYQYIKDQILKKYPWMETFVDLDAINTGGSFNSFGMGFRYVIQIGYHF